jgi:hypothetical protein
MQILTRKVIGLEETVKFAASSVILDTAEGQRNNLQSNCFPLHSCAVPNPRCPAHDESGQRARRELIELMLSAQGLLL